MQKLLWGILLISGVCFIQVTSAQDWEFRKSKDGIDVYFRESEDSKIKEVKIVGKIEGTSVTTALMVISDVERFPEWVYRCREASVLGGNYPRNFTYYNNVDFPWPLTDRQFVLRCTTYQHPKTMMVTAESFAYPEGLPPNDDYIRVEMVHSRWTFLPLDESTVEATYYLKADPGGSIPAWIINLALDSGPVKALQKVRERVKMPEYRNKKLAFIREK